MNIEIKKSIKPVNYEDAIKDLESRLSLVFNNKDRELIWTLQHNEIYTAGSSYKESEILNKSIKLIKTNRGGKITYHGPGQLICYFVIDLRNKKRISEISFVLLKKL
jgi:lipoyl(octanoyl) transferase